MESFVLLKRGGRQENGKTVVVKVGIGERELIREDTIVLLQPFSYPILPYSSFPTKSLAGTYLQLVFVKRIV